MPVQRRLALDDIHPHGEVLESPREDGVTVPGSPTQFLDGNIAHYNAPRGAIKTKGSRFARCFTAGTGGQGGLALRSPPGGRFVPTMLFEDSEWVGNAAASGPAVCVIFGQLDLAFTRCLFR